VSLVATAADQGGVPEGGYLDSLFRQSTATTNGRVVNKTDRDPFYANFRREISARARARREELGMSQHDVALKLGVTDRAIQGFERQAVPWERISQLAVVLDVSPRFLLTGDETVQERLSRIERMLEDLQDARATDREAGSGS
jgi:transcriptional regulator with XRE-family HTH domain